MQKGLNFNTIESQEKYFKVYDQSLKLLQVPFTETYVSTSFGDSHIICCGDKNKPALVLLHAASCGSTIWYPNIPIWSQEYCVYAIDLIGESSKSILTKKMKTPYDNAKWLDETLEGLELDNIYLCGLSIGGWTAINYAGYFPQRILKLILLSPVQSFAKMYPTYFIRIMKMGFHPTRENIENYIGWGNAKETSLPDSIIEQFTISVMNMNSNVSFPKWIKKEHFYKINMPVLVLFGENEFAFSIKKAIRCAHLLIEKLDIEVIKDASHLLSVSNSFCINQRVLNFLKDNKK